MLIFELVAQFTARYLPKFLPSAGHFYLILLQFCVAGSLALMVASISRRYFEEPFLRMKNRADRRTKAWSITGEHTNAQSLEIVAS
jgi:peptidoglycan/LPS O-acetylase OafA/YrhL